MLDAVILAAGAGGRMGDVPKALHSVGGRPLVDWSLDALARVGVERPLVVTGYHADAISTHVAKRARTAHNHEHVSAENFLSLAAGLREARPGRVLVINGDVIFRPSVLDEVLACDADLALAVSLGAADDEALKVEIRDGRVVRMGKALSVIFSDGEFIGVSALSQAARDAYLQGIEALLEGDRRTLYYEDVFSALCAGLHAIPVEVGDGDWAEIDTPADVPTAEAVAAALN